MSKRRSIVLARRKVQFSSLLASRTSNLDRLPFYVLYAVCILTGLLSCLQARKAPNAMHGGMGQLETQLCKDLRVDEDLRLIGHATVTQASSNVNGDAQDRSIELLSMMKVHCARSAHE